MDCACACMLFGWVTDCGHAGGFYEACLPGRNASLCSLKRPLKLSGRKSHRWPLRRPSAFHATGVDSKRCERSGLPLSRAVQEPFSFGHAGGLHEACWPGRSERRVLERETHWRANRNYRPAHRPKRPRKRYFFITILRIATLVKRQKDAPFRVFVPAGTPAAIVARLNYLLSYANFNGMQIRACRRSTEPAWVARRRRQVWPWRHRLRRSD